MRGFGFLFGSAKRNDPIRVVNPSPLPRYENELETGDAGRDGMTILSKAYPTMQGNPPSVPGVIGRVHRGPDESFEQ